MRTLIDITLTFISMVIYLVLALVINRLLGVEPDLFIITMLTLATYDKVKQMKVEVR